MKPHLHKVNGYWKIWDSRQQCQRWVESQPCLPQNYLALPVSGAKTPEEAYKQWLKVLAVAGEPV